MHQTQSQDLSGGLGRSGYARPVVIRLGTLRQITLHRGGLKDLLGVNGGNGKGNKKNDGGAYTQWGSRGS